MERIEEIRRRAEAATPGPWYKSGDRTVDALPGFYPILIAKTAQGNRGTPDADFISHAREDIPYLLNLIESLQAQLTEAQREQAAAAKCIYDIETYLDLGSAKYIKKTIDVWRGSQEGVEG